MSDSKEMTVAEAQPPQQVALTVQERAVIALGGAERESELKALAQKYADITEVKNKAGRQQVHAAAMELSKAITQIEKTGEAAREDAVAFQKAVIAEVKSNVAIVKPPRDRLIALRDAWDEAEAAEKAAKLAAEQARIAAIRSRIDVFRNAPAEMVGKSAQQIGACADHLSETVIALEDWQEFAGEAQVERNHAVTKLREMQAAQLSVEEAAAEAARQAEADRIERERIAEANRSEAKRLADLAAEMERQAKEARDRQAEADRIAREQREAADRMAQLAREEADRIAEAKRAAAQKILDDQATELRRQQDAADEVARVAREATEVESRAAQLESDHVEAIEENARINAERAASRKAQVVPAAAPVYEIAEMVSIPKKEYERLLDRDEWLSCLESAGVDNWDGFDEAREIMREQAA